MNQPVPARHPSKPGPVPAAVRLFATMLGVEAPSGERWVKLGTNLNIGDEPMDRLVEWMSSTGMEQTRPLFDRALTSGIASVPEAPDPLRAFFAEVETVPEWVDWELVRRGQRALRAGGADGMYVARDVSLLGGYQFSGFNKTLIRTGALEKGSNKRFAETMQWALDIISENGMAPLGIGYRSTIRVRLIHAFVRRHVAAMPDWRGDEWGVPVNQTDMAATLVGALIAPPVGALGMGLLLPPKEYEAIAHLTRYVGWLIGVDDEWLPRDFRDSVRVLYHTVSALSEPDESTKQLAMPMADDPMLWQYRSMSGLRRRVARSQHLSVTSGFLGPRAMRALGLSPWVVPWYPVVRMPVNLLRSAAVFVRPDGIERAAVRGDREQKAWLRTIIGEDEATIGESAAHVSRVA
ncbi:hypothetical protein A5765_02260 [Mycolicibacterium celeriflavum]|uniref:oxygenase MpaB family protein n=1 Tax=Mycolicibacterium celeriflavum TaxID=1249101 RepID=UPI0008001C35|nr:oxygenase MpaB family protein [Mycolicibacterium celeriflavum]OBG19422.1 hypothetical protein A5765_02260 [Mycolicibacterium celeriflavum]